MCSLAGILWWVGGRCEFVFSTLPIFYFQIRLQPCGSQHTKVATIWDSELHHMQFLFLSSWIGSTKLLQSKTNAMLYLGCVLKDSFFSSTWLKSSTFCRKQMKLEYVSCWDSDLQRNNWDFCISLLPMPIAGAATVDCDGDESELLQGDLLESSKLIYPKQKNSHITTVEQQQTFHTKLLVFASTHLEVQGKTSTLIIASWCFWCFVDFLLGDGICSK